MNTLDRSVETLGRECVSPRLYIYNEWGLTWLHFQSIFPPFAHLRKHFCRNKIYQFSFVETQRRFTIAKLSIRKLGSSSVLMLKMNWWSSERRNSCTFFLLQYIQQYIQLQDRLTFKQVSWKWNEQKRLSILIEIWTSKLICKLKITVK